MNNNGRRTARRRNKNSNARRTTCFDRQISARTVTFSTFISLDPMSQRDHRALPQFPGRATHEGDLMHMHCGFRDSAKRLPKIVISSVSYQKAIRHKPSCAINAAHCDCANNWTGRRYTFVRNVEAQGGHCFSDAGTISFWNVSSSETIIFRGLKIASVVLGP